MDQSIDIPRNHNTPKQINNIHQHHARMIHNPEKPLSNILKMKSL